MIRQRHHAFRLLLLTASILVLTCGVIPAQEAAPLPEDSVTSTPLPAAPRPVTSVKAQDTKGDAGGSITITWGLSPDDAAGSAADVTISGYEIFRAIRSQLMAPLPESTCGSGGL